MRAYRAVRERGTRPALPALPPPSVWSAALSLLHTDSALSDAQSVAMSMAQVASMSNASVFPSLRAFRVGSAPWAKSRPRFVWCIIMNKSCFYKNVRERRDFELVYI
jgi:hypothetical protein